MLSLPLPFTSLPCLIAQRGISNTEATGVVRGDIHGLFQVLWEWQAVCHHHYVWQYSCRCPEWVKELFSNSNSWRVFFFFLRMAVGFCQELLLHLWSHILLLYRVLIPWMDGPGIQPEHLFSFWTHVVSVTSHSPIAWELSQGSKLWHLDICVLSLKDQPSLERGAEFEITLLAVLVYVVYVHTYVHVLTCMCVGVLCACVCTCVGVCTCMGAFCAPVCTCVWSFQGGTPGHYSALVGREGYR